MFTEIASETFVINSTLSLMAPLKTHKQAEEYLRGADG